MSAEVYKGYSSEYFDIVKFIQTSNFNYSILFNFLCCMIYYKNIKNPLLRGS